MSKVLYLEQVHNDPSEIDVTNDHDVEMSEELQFPHDDGRFTICM